jgi:hypothetical protein
MVVGELEAFVLSLPCAYWFWSICWAGTIAEASTRGLPCMLFNFLPGQEEGNVPFVIKSGFGDYSRDPKVGATHGIGRNLSEVPVGV